MKNSIDIEKLVGPIRMELSKQTTSEFFKLAESVKSGDNSTEKMADLLFGIFQLLKNHSEKFTVELVKKVIEESEKQKP